MKSSLSRGLSRRQSNASRRSTSGSSFASQRGTSSPSSPIMCRASQSNAAIYEPFCDGRRCAMISMVNTGAPRKRDRKPRIVVVADDKDDLALLSTEIEGRYGDAYNVLVAISPGEALKSLKALR